MAALLKYQTLNDHHQPIKPTQTKALRDATRCHTESFNFMTTRGVPDGVPFLPQQEVEVDGQVVQFWIESVSINMPTIHVPPNKSRMCYPSECRERRCTYKGDLQVRLMCAPEDAEEPWVIDRVLGQIPIMVLSNRCYLKNKTPAELVNLHEEPEEMGGYFVINGNEKIIRMLLIQRRNHVMALNRPSFTKRGPGYTEYGTVIRCVRPDQMAQGITCHYLADGTCTVGFSYRKQQYLVPVLLILRAIIDVTDKEIYDALVQGANDNTFLVERVEVMLSMPFKKALYSRKQCLEYLGSRFRVALGLPNRLSDYDAGLKLIDRVLFIHLEQSDYKGKFDLMILMLQKLYALVSGDCAADNPDSQMNQELLLPGHLYSAFLMEQLGEYLLQLRKTIMLEQRIGKIKVNFSDETYFRKVLAKAPDVGRKIEYLMTTGNLISPTGLGLMQATGLTVVADKLNFQRYLSHFRCVHRGGYFTEMKTTTVRKLLPESWGFLCPVHTPDGSPCGLLNHMTRSCEPSCWPSDTSKVASRLYSLGVTPLEGVVFPPNFRSVVLDGKIIGKVAADRTRAIAEQLRMLKVSTEDNDIPSNLEICHIPDAVKGQYPGIFLYSTPARMLRSVKNLRSNTSEVVGTFEQAYMDICIRPKEYIPGVTTHMEHNQTNFISMIANLTPFSDFNQSPRNMYQCQMGKQTMGVPCYSFQHRSDNKLYCINTPQRPMVRPTSYDEFNMNSYPIGTNAIVAVMAYTGYDMEDAMIVNAASMQRGFAHAHIIVTKVADLADYREPGQRLSHYFGYPEDEPTKKRVGDRLGSDGFPHIGETLSDGDPLYCVLDNSSGLVKAKIQRYKGEPAVVQQVTLLGAEASSIPMRATIKLHVNRNPIIGDKFASRHGQKGILSQLWPAENMPFTESGMMPDILFNPHGFPSRMTIGMMIESMAGKSAALNGVGYDATPFQFSEDDTAIDFFGKELEKSGYSYFGQERLYSGITGEEFDADIFIGNVYYQRLRHMVSDKYQVRATGPIHNLTHQPIKGRKRAGGVRFGEMERDSLLSHGTSFLLQDRLFHCSDASEAFVCRLCGSLLTPQTEENSNALITESLVTKCSTCDTSKGIVKLNVPYVFRYLVAELLAMNIQLSLDIGTIENMG